jgi:hypothetical protein
MAPDAARSILAGSEDARVQVFLAANPYRIRN